MSLWRKEPEQITFADIEAYCSQGIRESIRLDYKKDMPSKLQKVVAACANTMGGLVLLGVDMDPKTNQPIFPLVGMPARLGIEDQITASCQDGIYPPVLPRMSLPLEVPGQADRIIVLLRIDQSPEAPHAVDGQVYVRVGSQGRPYGYEPAHIDQIRLLLSRRDDLEQQRLKLIAQEIRRGVLQLTGTSLLLGEEAGLRVPAVSDPAESCGLPRGLPFRWASIIPVYPWRNLCQPKDCYDLLRLFGFGSSNTWQKVPGGALALRRDDFGGRMLTKGCCSLSSKGHIYAMEFVRETWTHSRSSAAATYHTRPSGSPPGEHFLSYLCTKTLVEETVTAAHAFYSQGNVELPGYLYLSVGLIGVFGLRMIRQQAERSYMDESASGKPFVDEDFDTQVMLTTSEFLSDPVKSVTPLLEEIKYGFDI